VETEEDEAKKEEEEIRKFEEEEKRLMAKGIFDSLDDYIHFHYSLEQSRISAV
jgi:hypothetical protein